MTLNPEHIVRRLFEETEAENFDFTITLSDSEDEERWLQLRGSSINVPYPHSDSPEQVMPGFDVFGTVSWGVDSWEPGRYATLDWGVDEGPERRDERLVLTTVLTRMLENYLGLPVDSGRWVVEEA
ncbi:hypothetical protein ACWEFL_26335 [Streptomyces sp. NPDC004838]